MNQFEQVDFDHVKVTFSNEELRYIENDLIGRILEIALKVLGDEAFNYSLSNADNLPEGKKETLEACGVYDRIALLRKVQKIESECFPDISTNI